MVREEPETVFGRIRSIVQRRKQEDVLSRKKPETWWERYKKEVETRPDVAKEWNVYSNQTAGKEEIPAKSVSAENPKKDIFERHDALLKKRKREVETIIKRIKQDTKKRTELPKEEEETTSIPEEMPQEILPGKKEAVVQDLWDKHAQEFDNTKKIFEKLDVRGIEEPKKVTLFHQLFQKQKKQENKSKIEHEILKDIPKIQAPEEKQKVPGIFPVKPAEAPKKEIAALELPVKKQEIAKSIVIETIMTKNPVFIDESDTIEKALEFILKYNIRGVPVLKNDKVIGIIEEKDVLNYFKKIIPLTEGSIRLNSKKIEELSKRKVTEIITRKPVTLSQKDSIERAVTEMQENDVGRVAIVENGKLIGIITRDDVVKALVRSIIAGDILTSDVMRTDIDRLHDLIDQKGRITTEDASRLLKIDKVLVEEWAAILEDHGMITVDYPVIGTVELVKKID